MKKQVILSMFILFAVSLNAQIKVHQNQTVQIGNTSASLFNTTARFEVNVPEAVIRLNSSANYGFRFITATDQIPITVTLPNGRVTTMISINNVIALTGLSDCSASIGRPNNTMNVIYSNMYYSSGNYIGNLSSSDASLKTNVRELPSITNKINDKLIATKRMILTE